MKCTLILMLAACLQVCASGYSQTISVKLREVPFEKALKEIAKKCGHGLFYLQEQIKGSKPVSITKDNTDVKQVLDELFKEQPLKYEITNKTIVVSPKEEKKATSSLTQDLSPGLTPEPPPTIDVSGRITDEDGNPLMGASIIVKGTNIATSTNADGFFVLKGINEKAVLEISYIGYEKKEILANGAKVLTSISLKRIENVLNEIIIKPYWRETKRMEVGNTGRITAKEIENQPVNNPILALQGRIPGLVVSPQNGISGGGITIRIQGRNNLNPAFTGSDPFIIIDGVPYASQNLTTFIGGDAISPILGSSTNDGVGSPNSFGNPLTFLNPTDIESIDVLKDADATAIYGSRAANGAIIITTKKGKAGAMRTVLNLQNGWGQLANRMDLLDRDQYMQMRWEAKRNDNASVLSSDFDLRGLWDTTMNTDWQKILIGGIAQFKRASLRVSGGSDNVQYLLSGTYGNETTVFPGDFNNSFGAIHMNITASSLNQRFRIQLSANYQRNRNDLPASDFTQLAVNLPPVAPPIYKLDGTLNWASDPQNNNQSSWFNPLSRLHNIFSTNTDNLVSSGSLIFRVLPGLELKSTFGATITNSDQFTAAFDQYIKPELRVNRVRSARYTYNSVQSWIVEPQIHFRREWGNHQLQAFVGSTFQNQSNDGRSFGGSGYPSDQLLRNLNAATTKVVSAPDLAVYRYNALFGRLSYTMKNKYLVNLTARRDGSSRFGANNLIANFGSIGAGWIISDETFVQKKLPFISFAKIRGSYGTTGNDQIGNYRFMSLYAPTTYTIPYQNISGLTPMSLPNPNLEWEETRKLQIGLDLGFVKDRISFSATYFRNRSSNSLSDLALPMITGNISLVANIPALIQNSGWEFLLSSKIFKNDKLTWNTSINLTIPRNKLLAFPGVENSSLKDIVSIGYSLNSVKTYAFYGIDPLTGTYLQIDRNGTIGSNFPFGTEDRIQDRGARWYGGFQNTISYKAFTLDILFQFAKQYGTQILQLSNYPGRVALNSTIVSGNQPVQVLDRWQNPGDMTGFPRFSSNSTISGINAGDRTFMDVSYLRLKNVAISYHISPKLLDTYKIKEFRLYANAQNLFTLTRYLGFDPETLNVNSLPLLRMITVGLQVGF